MPWFFQIADGTEFTFGLVMLVTLLSYGLMVFVLAMSFAANRGWKAAISVVYYEVIWMTAIVLLCATLLPASVMMY